MRQLPLLVATLAACAGSPSRVDDPDAVVTESGRLAARIVREPHDPDRRAETSKVYHHVYAPDGRLLTKGLGGQFDHHRGIFLGWNQLQWNGQRFDFWHCNHGESLQFRGFLTLAGRSIGPGWQTCGIDWCMPDGQVALKELRLLHARELDADTTILDVRTDLRATGDIVLAGDPQHAGQQFRALQLFAEDAGPKVDYIRPESATGEPNDVWQGCDWIAAVLPMPEGDVTVLRIEGADNPRPTIWSTRAYGRFGATFTAPMAKGEVLRLSWTYVIANGRRDLDWCRDASVRCLARN